MPVPNRYNSQFKGLLKLLKRHFNLCREYLNERNFADLTVEEARFVSTCSQYQSLTTTTNERFINHLNNVDICRHRADETTNDQDEPQVLTPPGRRLGGEEPRTVSASPQRTSVWPSVSNSIKLFLWLARLIRDPPCVRAFIYFDGDGGPIIAYPVRW